MSIVRKKYARLSTGGVMIRCFHGCGPIWSLVIPLFISGIAAAAQPLNIVDTAAKPSTVSKKFSAMNWSTDLLEQSAPRNVTQTAFCREISTPAFVLWIRNAPASLWRHVAESSAYSGGEHQFAACQLLASQAMPGETLASLKKSLGKCTWLSRNHISRAQPPVMTAGTPRSAMAIHLGPAGIVFLAFNQAVSADALYGALHHKKSNISTIGVTLAAVGWGAPGTTANTRGNVTLRPAFWLSMPGGGQKAVGRSLSAWAQTAYSPRWNTVSASTIAARVFLTMRVKPCALWRRMADDRHCARRQRLWAADNYLLCTIRPGDSLKQAAKAFTGAPRLEPSMVESVSMFDFPPVPFFRRDLLRRGSFYYINDVCISLNGFMSAKQLRLSLRNEGRQKWRHVRVVGIEWDGGPIGETYRTISNPGAAGTKTVETSNLHTIINFNGGNGANPHGRIIFDRAGNYFGTTTRGGPKGGGTVFRITPTGKLATLATLSKSKSEDVPNGLAIDKNGNLFGAIFGLNRGGNGGIFKLTSAGIFTVLVSFNRKDRMAGPWGSPLLDSAGNIYGTTVLGGDSYYRGVIFKLTRAGKLMTLVKVGDIGGDFPEGCMAMDKYGNLYGTTSRGGIHTAGDPSGCGMIFKLTPHDKLIALLKFRQSDGADPKSGLIMDRHGNLYGTTSEGGIHSNNVERTGYGTVFKFTSSGKLITLVNFNGYDGAAPFGRLAKAPNGDLYGVTSWGGAYGMGTVYKIGMDGKQKVLVNFNGVNGADPEGGLTFDKAGNIYGTTSWGGSHGKGTVFVLPVHK